MSSPELRYFKFFVGQLKQAHQVSGESGKREWQYGQMGPFTRVWVQGVVVGSPPSERPCWFLDDGTGVAVIFEQSSLPLGESLKLGAYVMVLGQFRVASDSTPAILIHKLVNLSTQPQRESLWFLEVIEAHSLPRH